MAIAAKGGRENLHGAKSLLTSYHRTLKLCVFPDRLWEWDDSRPSPFGLSVRMYNTGLQIGYYLKKGMKKPVQDYDPEYIIGRLMRDQLVYFMETAWVKPVPYDYGEDFFRGQPVDVVYARIGDMKISYLLDRNTHLPVAYRHHVTIHQRKLPTGHIIPEHESARPITLVDYVDVNGIKMPSKVQYLPETAFVLKTYQINVQFDPTLFERPPSIKAGKDAWRPKRP
jgi:hypothetical protein